MCGVVALFLKRPLRAADIALGRAATEALRHRGPDAGGEWISEGDGVFFGHRRLKVIDLSEANNQPLQRDESVITYNGEIYNFRQVRQTLQDKNIHFQTNGDVEVVVRAWQTWQDDMFQRLDGMFAFAFWDGHRGIVATDAFGEKPLFYAETTDGLYFSSEIRPLAQLLDLQPSMDDETLATFLALGFVPPPKTAFQNIRRVGAAKRLIIEHGKIVDERTYWRPPVKEIGGGTMEPLSSANLDDLQAVLSDSVAGRLVSDVPVSIFLSRGIDSALVAAMASQDHGAQPRCLTVAYSEGATVNEAPDAEKIARFLRLEHETIVNNTRPDDASPETTLDILQQPSEGITMLSVRQMSEAAANDFKVALTGSGGDEVTLGYGKNAYFYDRRRMYAMPELIRRLIGLMAKPLSGFDQRIARYLDTVGVRDDEAYIAYKNQPAIHWLRELPGFRQFCQNMFTTSDPLAIQTARIEWDHVMPGLRLVNLDHGAMHASLELRTPYLSRKLVEKVAEFDPRSFIGYGQKSVLRRLLARYLPEHLFNHPKSGFVFPPDIFLNQRGPAIPEIPNLSTEISRQVWDKRFDGGGWTRIAVRMAVASAFFDGASTK